MTDHSEAMSQLPHKLATLIQCLPQAPFREHLAAECIKQAERIAELELQPAFAQLASDLAVKLAATEAERDQLRAEVERLRPNAERYEWLRDNLESEWAICEWQDDPDGLGYYRDARAPEVVDAAIDNARTHKDTP